MLKKRVLTVSLSLLACLCCYFSGFGSVRAFAYSAEYHLYPRVGQFWCSGVSVDEILNHNFSMTLDTDNSFYYTYSDSISPVYSYPYYYFGTDLHNFIYPYEPDLYDYYGIGSYSFNSPTDIFLHLPQNFSGLKSVDFYNFDVDTQTYRSSFSTQNIAFSSNSNSLIYNFYVPFEGYHDFSIFRLNFDNLNYTDRRNVTIRFEFSVLAVAKDTSADAVQSIITAINNQTGTLQGSIDQASDDIQQSIEDQYQMEDEEDFGFSDIQQQYEEKMGVLTFGTETTIQMLELFSPSNAGEAYIRVPGWSMDVQGETYQIWDEYVFYFDSIEENFPFLVTTMRTFTVAMFYVAIVGYITKVYERNFLAK